MLAVTSCAATVAGSARKSIDPSNPDDVTVGMLDTGDYRVTPGHPIGPAGDAEAGSIAESRRLAEYVVGPWEVDSTLRQPEPRQTSPFLPSPGSYPDSLPDIVRAHGLIAGFSTARETTGSDPRRELVSIVMRFPDPASAADAAQQLAAKDDGAESDIATDSPAGATTRHPVTITDHPEAIAWSYDREDGSDEVHSYIAHGVYVFNQRARDSKELRRAALLAEWTINQQAQLIDHFTPTDPAKLKDLPKDPSGWLMSRVLLSPEMPAITGAWPPGAALHFEDNPAASNTFFTAAGVQWMGQGLTRVYVTKDVNGAGLVVAKLVEQATALPDVEPTTKKVPGMPQAKCFERSRGYTNPNDAPTLKQQLWHYMCVARADRFATVAYTTRDLADAMRQTSAQWRILAGK